METCGGGFAGDAVDSGDFFDMAAVKVSAWRTDWLELLHRLVDDSDHLCADPVTHLHSNRLGDSSVIVTIPTIPPDRPCSLTRHDPSSHFQLLLCDFFRLHYLLFTTFWRDSKTGQNVTSSSKAMTTAASLLTVRCSLCIVTYHLPTQTWACV